MKTNIGLYPNLLCLCGVLGTDGKRKEAVVGCGGVDGAESEAKRGQNQQRKNKEIFLPRLDDDKNHEKNGKGLERGRLKAKQRNKN